MRAVAFVLALIALAPAAAGAGYTLGKDRTIEASLDGAASAAFEMPLRIEQDGAVYAKLLPVEDNAAREPGWSLAFAIVRADGSRVEMGGGVDGSPSDLAPVVAGEEIVFVATLTPPAGAPDPSRVYVALAFRAGAPGAASESGASMDEARALTLILTGAPPAAAASPVNAVDDNAVPLVEPIVDDRGSIPESPSAPVGIAESGSVVLALLAIAIGVLALAVAGLTVAVLLVWREMRRARTATSAISIPIRETDDEPDQVVRTRGR